MVAVAAVPQIHQLSRLEAALLIGGPALLVTGWIVLIAGAGQGATDGWFVGHYMLFVANAAWVPISLILTRLAAGPGTALSDPAVWLILLGSLAISGQLAIDMVGWALDLGPAALTDFFAALRERPLLSLTLHVIGPSLLFLGLFVAAVRIVRRPVTRIGGLLIAGGILVVFAGALLNLSLVILTGYVAVLAGLAGVSMALTGGGEVDSRV